LLIGDAAGAVSPLTAGGLDPCMRLVGDGGKCDLGKIKKRRSENFTELFGRAFPRPIRFAALDAANHFAFSNQMFLELGFAFLRGRIGRKLAKHVFFGRGSFPDVEIQSVKRQRQNYLIKKKQINLQKRGNKK
jgi:hypothetical protein